METLLAGHNRKGLKHYVIKFHYNKCYKHYKVLGIFMGC